MTEEPYRIHRTPALTGPSLIVAWSPDAGGLGPHVCDFLVRKLGAEGCAAMEPLAFFHLAGVSIEDDVIQFPESRLYCSPEKNLLIFRSDIPGKEHYRFLAALLDIAQQHYGAMELYTIGGLVSLIAHTRPRRVFSVVNQPPLKEALAQYGLETGLDYDTPAGSRPTLSSYLLWVAKRRQLAGISLWAEVPFYLAGDSDAGAARGVLSFLDRRFGLGMDFAELDLAVREQDEALAQLREGNGAVGKYLEILEKGIVLTQDEQERMTSEVTEFLERQE